jgi:anti-sigma factor RsiW
MSDQSTYPKLVGYVTDYLDGTMRPEDRQSFDAHLETCDECRSYVDQVRRAISLTGRPPAETLSLEFQQHLADVCSGFERSRT